MGSSHSKPARHAANHYCPYKDKKYPRGAIGLNFVYMNPSYNLPKHNAFLAAPSFGRAVHLNPRDMQMQKVGNCCMCRRTIDKESDDIVLHNMKGCQAAYHAYCMKKWIQQNFIDRHGREMRPQCYKCSNTLNIRLGKGRTKQNPMGLYAFPGPAFPGTGPPIEVSGWC
ncbi:hypothetical protein H2198_009543 [Neophaeococcomyces mojaviensis]|uniref:Uncharacterized protein n=1 Tax=Neophaeococcomyces mojaviensis TaxID=3383035 RepID=A0ACC2ZUD7_9EURO|nr:hypothetical protein H2198_009543 [Knufia sp. JES_112]